MGVKRRMEVEEEIVCDICGTQIRRATCVFIEKRFVTFCDSCLDKKLAPIEETYI